MASRIKDNKEEDSSHISGIKKKNPRNAQVY